MGHEMRLGQSTLVFLAVSMIGCATVSNIDTKLANLKGAPIERVVVYLGAPDSYVELPNTRIYRWLNSETLDLVIPDTTYGSGYSTSGEYVTTTNYGTKTTSTDLSCRITLTTNREGVIRDSEVQGDFISCGAFAKKVERIPQQRTDTRTYLTPHQRAGFDEYLDEEEKKLCAIRPKLSFCAP